MQQIGLLFEESVDLAPTKVETKPIVLIYEYPLTERIRALLRLEDLFARMAHYLGAPDIHDHHAALTVLFEILEVARPDLKSELLQELERQRQVLTAFRDNPNISSEALDTALDEISEALNLLHALSGKLGQHLRDNEWLISVMYLRASSAGLPPGSDTGQPRLR